MHSSLRLSHARAYQIHGCALRTTSFSCDDFYLFGLSTFFASKTRVNWWNTNMIFVMQGLLFAMSWRFESHHFPESVYVFSHLFVNKAKHQMFLVIAKYPDSMLNLIINHGLLIAIKVINIHTFRLTHPILLISNLGAQRHYFFVDRLRLVSLEGRLF